MRGSSHDCESTRAPLLCYYLPCLPKSKEEGAGGGPVSGSAILAEKPPLVQKIEAVVAPGGCGEDEDEDEGGCKEVPVVGPRSSLKRAECVDGKRGAKGNVKWMDFVGKELAQVREYEPSDSEDSDDDEDANPCTCVIL